MSICRHCYRRHIFHCEECGDDVFGDTMHVVRNGEIINICEHCRDEEANTCEECGEECIGECKCETVNV